MVDRLPPPSHTPAMNGFTFHIRVLRMLCMHNDKFLPVRTTVAVTSINNNQQSVNRRPYIVDCDNKEKYKDRMEEDL